ncbi:MAG TPA: NAD-dependent epimerase/dehydratase family protein [Pyrinomonadaceae bacterium]|nr:NAD-dependent epimerase/dehydratase family protein [Pyrinomonadaceae bacterium]
MRVVVIGGGGFVGSALVKHLSARHACVCFGHGGRFEELRGKINGGVEYVEGEVTDAGALREVMRGADAAVYAAGTGGEADCLKDPTRSLLSHVYGVQSAAREAADANVARFVFTSTIAVYGTYTARPMPLTEDMIARPDEFYGALKASAERALIDSGRFRILRLSNVYGYGGGLFSLSSGVAGKFVELISQGKPLRVYGDGSQRIDYVHADDVCRAYELALGAGDGRSFVYNVGGGRPVSIRELAETAATLAEELTGTRAEIEYAPAPADKLWPDRRLSIEKIERELGWRPKVSIGEGLREMLTDWTRESVGS